VIQGTWNGVRGGWGRVQTAPNTQWGEQSLPSARTVICVVTGHMGAAKGSSLQTGCPGSEQAGEGEGVIGRVSDIGDRREGRPSFEKGGENRTWKNVSKGRHSRKGGGGATTLFQNIRQKQQTLRGGKTPIAKCQHERKKKERYFNKSPADGQGAGTGVPGERATL